MSASLASYLKELLDTATADLADVTPKKMFGCNALFRQGSIFALIWKTGRIGLKIPDPGLFTTLMNMPGAEPWTARNKAMSHWVLVPEGFHDDEEQLRHWTQAAHRLAGATLKVKGSQKRSTRFPMKSPPV